mgnify:CR=1 FL=1
MKCIEACGYRAKPDNLNVLKSHIEECMAEGACRSLKKEPVIVWRDSEFTAAEKPKSKKEKVFPVTYVKKEALDLTPEMIKPVSEVVKAKAKKPTVTRGTISDTASEKRRIKTKATGINPDGGT